MATFSIFDIAGSGMTAQALRLNVTASNLANVDDVASNPEDVYRARHPLFKARPMDFGSTLAAVAVLGVVESKTEALSRYQPGHPLADDAGMIYTTNVNAIEEMANMISASKSYQSNLEVVNTAKDLMLRTLTLGQ
jgi:flagellar basal-body rod protein FlgC